MSGYDIDKPGRHSELGRWLTARERCEAQLAEAEQRIADAERGLAQARRAPVGTVGELLRTVEAVNTYEAALATWEGHAASARAELAYTTRRYTATRQAAQMWLDEVERIGAIKNRELRALRLEQWTPRIRQMLG